MVTVHNVADDNMCRCMTAHFVVHYAGGKERSSRHILSPATVCADGRQYVQLGSVHIVADDNMYKTTICTVTRRSVEIRFNFFSMFVKRLTNRESKPTFNKQLRHVNLQVFETNYLTNNKLARKSVLVYTFIP